MDPIRSQRFLILITMLILLGPVAVLAAETQPAAKARETGDLWEVTSKMSMEGMPMEMPAHTMKVCTTKEWKKPPAPENEQQKCQCSDFKVVGPKATWKVRCANPEMTGEGEITRNGADAYTGAIKFAGEEGAMTMKLNGKRVGECDPAKE